MTLHALDHADVRNACTVHSSRACVKSTSLNIIDGDASAAILRITGRVHTVEPAKAGVDWAALIASTTADLALLVDRRRVRRIARIGCG